MNWKYDLDEYIRQGEADKIQKSAGWQTAIGLQEVDGLSTSEYLIETAKEHIEGNIDIAEAKNRIQSYYIARDNRQVIEEKTKEADIVSVRIAEILCEQTFNFSPIELQNIHRRLFEGILDKAGTFRTYNITKNEWVLNGETILYSSYESIRETLNYDFEQEKAFSYENISIQEAVKHIAKFTSGIWQIHPFCEGNTRTTAVFIIKYLKMFGFNINNNAFADNSWYFRNALVRANYNNLQANIHSTAEFLELFFDNLLFEANNSLQNRSIHINFQSAEKDNSKCQNDTLNCTLEEFAVIKIIKENPKITQKELAVLTGKSERSIKRITVTLQEKNIIKRANGKRNGHWELLVYVPEQ